MKQFEEAYYDLSHPAGYSGARRIIAKFGDKKKEEIKEWLNAQDTYTLHRSIKRKFPRLHNNLNNIDQLWEMDLVDLRSLKSYNDNFSYILVCIDALSKYVWVEPMKDKSATTTTDAFKKILERSDGRVPMSLQSDKGKEFLGKVMQKFLSEQNIIFRVVRSPDVKAGIVERVNRTLKERMYRYFTHKRTYRYIDILQQLVNGYNHSVHSATRMTPASVTLFNADEARANIEKKYKLAKVRTPKYKVGCLVRISREKTIFEKGYEYNWSKEIFKISKVINWRRPQIYEIHDLNDEEVEGFFYEEELVPVNKDLLKEEYEIERIVKTKGTGKNKKYLIKWKNYTEDFNSWVPASDVKDLKNNHE